MIPASQMAVEVLQTGTELFESLLQGEFVPCAERLAPEFARLLGLAGKTEAEILFESVLESGFVPASVEGASELSAVALAETAATEAVGVEAFGAVSGPVGWVIVAGTVAASVLDWIKRKRVSTAVASGVSVANVTVTNTMIDLLRDLLPETSFWHGPDLEDDENKQPVRRYRRMESGRRNG